MLKSQVGIASKADPQYSRLCSYVIKNYLQRCKKTVLKINLLKIQPSLRTRRGLRGTILIRVTQLVSATMQLAFTCQLDNFIHVYAINSVDGTKHDDVLVLDDLHNVLTTVLRNRTFQLFSEDHFLAKPPCLKSIVSVPTSQCAFQD